MTLIFVVAHYMDGCFFTSEERKKNPQIDNSITICRQKMPAFFSEDFAYCICSTKNKQKRGDKYEKDCISDINNPDDYLYGTGNHP